jgi:hypothetical protein
MVKYECKGCGAMTSNPERLCQRCRGLVKLIRQIKAMLKPSCDLKKELEKRHMWEAAKAEVKKNGN